MRPNGFHVQAVGWMLVFNVRVFQPDESQDVLRLWAALVEARREELRQASLASRLAFPRATPLAPTSQAALGALVDRLITLHPERFDLDALRQRRNAWLLNMACWASLFLGAARWLLHAWPLTHAIVPTLFILSLASLLPLLTLWRAVAAVNFARSGWRGRTPLLQEQMLPSLSQPAARDCLDPASTPQTQQR